MIDAHTMPRQCEDCSTCAVSEWQVLDDTGKQRLREVRRTSNYVEGETLFHQNDESHGIYCLESGNVLLRQFDVFGNETDLKLILGHSTLGWGSYFAGRLHSTSAVALTQCRACYIPGNSLQELMQDYPPLAMRLLQTLARNQEVTESLLLRSPLLPTRTRVINLILTMAAQIGTRAENGRTILALPLTRHQVASMVGVREETLSRTLSALSDEGVLEIDRRDLVIHDIERLRREVHFHLTS